MVTIETIAEKAGVSRGTVDRVLHQRGRVNKQTEERVLAVMEALNFQPSSLGRAFYIAREKNRIGVLISFREEDFQRQVMQGVTDGIAYARQHGIQIITESAPPDDEAAYVETLERLTSRGIRGLILRGIESNRVNVHLRKLAQEKMPVITYNADIESKQRNCFVGQNSYQSGACAAFLIQQICPQNGYTLILRVDPTHFSSEERVQGFVEYFQKTPNNQMEISPVMYSRGCYERAYKLTQEMLVKCPQMTGIFVSGAGLSGAAHAVADAGLSGIVKIVGFDATESNVAFMKKDTVQFLIDQDPYQQGYKPIQLLTDSIFKEEALETDYYDTGIQIKTPYNC